MTWTISPRLHRDTIIFRAHGAGCKVSSDIQMACLFNCSKCSMSGQVGGGHLECILRRFYVSMYCQYVWVFSNNGIWLVVKVGVKLKVCVRACVWVHRANGPPPGSCLQGPVRSHRPPEGVCCWTLVFYSSSSKHDRLFGDHLFPMAAAW